jgi:hypothetical protein
MKVLRSLALALVGCVALAGPAGAASTHDRTVVVDLSAVGQTNIMTGDFFSSLGVTFPAQQCGPVTCLDWFVGWIQGDDAIGAGDYNGPITARFSMPVSAISVQLAPAFQYRGSYTLSAFDANGRLVGQKTVVKNQDPGLPDFTGWGYFPVSLTHLSGPACSMRVSGTWLNSSWTANGTADFGLSSITLQRQAVGPSQRCSNS